MSNRDAPHAPNRQFPAATCRMRPIPNRTWTGLSHAPGACARRHTVKRRQTFSRFSPVRARFLVPYPLPSAAAPYRLAHIPPPYRLTAAAVRERSSKGSLPIAHQQLQPGRRYPGAQRSGIRGMCLAWTSTGVGLCPCGSFGCAGPWRCELAGAPFARYSAVRSAPMHRACAGSFIRAQLHTAGLFRSARVPTQGWAVTAQARSR